MQNAFSFIMDFFIIMRNENFSKMIVMCVIVEMFVKQCEGSALLVLLYYIKNWKTTTFFTFLPIPKYIETLFTALIAKEMNQMVRWSTIMIYRTLKISLVKTFCQFCHFTLNDEILLNDEIF